MLYIIVVLSDGSNEFSEAAKPLPEGWNIKTFGNASAALAEISEHSQQQEGKFKRKKGEIAAIVMDEPCGRIILESLEQDNILLVLLIQGLTPNNLELVEECDLGFQADMLPAAVIGAIIHAKTPKYQ